MPVATGGLGSRSQVRGRNQAEERNGSVDFRADMFEQSDKPRFPGCGEREGIGPAQKTGIRTQ